MKQKKITEPARKEWIDFNNNNSKATSLLFDGPITYYASSLP
jgi:hypothetical protein